MKFFLIIKKINTIQNPAINGKQILKFRLEILLYHVPFHTTKRPNIKNQINSIYNYDRGDTLLIELALFSIVVCELTPERLITN